MKPEPITPIAMRGSSATNSRAAKRSESANIGWLRTATASPSTTTSVHRSDVDQRGSCGAPLRRADERQRARRKSRRGSAAAARR